MKSIPRLTTQSCLNMHQIASHIHFKIFPGTGPQIPLGSTWPLGLLPPNEKS